MQRSEAVGAITLKKGSAALFYEAAEGKFTLVETLPDTEAANVFDCVPREQWGRTVMLFGHATPTGGYIALGHATLDGISLKIKLASGRYYRIDVDPSQAHLQPFVSAEPVAAQSERPPRPERTDRPDRGGAKLLRRDGRKPRPAVAPANDPVPHPPHHSQQDSGDESEDLTADDLRRLRGEMPLSSKPKRQWKR